MANSTPLQFDIPDMTHAAAITSIEQAIRAIDPAADIVADLHTNRVMVGSTASAGDVAEAIAAAGFTVKAAG